MAALGLTFFSLMTWAIWRSQPLGSRIIDQDYYIHGQQQTRAMNTTGAAEPGSLGVTLTRSGVQLDTLIVDEHGKAVCGAQGEIYLFGRRGNEQRLPMLESGRGHYLAQLPEALQHDTQIQLRLQYGATRFEQMLLLTP